jgi:hypothetical protein
MSTITTPAQSATSPTSNKLEHYARWGLWALPVWASLLFLGTLTHQPSAQTDFPGYARYITTPEFLISHLVASILGAGIGTLGLIALLVVLCKGRTASLALWACVSGVIGNTLVTSIFGVAAFFQPAIGRAYLAGHTAEAVAINNDVYGAALFAMALPGLLLLTIGIVLFGVAVVRAGSLPKLAGIGFALGGVLFAVIGFVLADFVQSIGAALLVASTVWIAIVGWRTLHPQVPPYAEAMAS